MTTIIISVGSLAHAYLLFQTLPAPVEHWDNCCSGQKPAIDKTHFPRPQPSRFLKFNQVNNSPRRIRQQRWQAIDRFLLFIPQRVRVDDLWTDRTGFPELNEEAVGSNRCTQVISPMVSRMFAPVP